MAKPKVDRRLTAILAADVAGYSRLVATDEEAALAAFAQHLREVVEPAVDGQGGRIIKTTGDGVLAQFASAVSALESAVSIQRAMAERNTGVEPERRITFRIGVHAADVVVQEGDLLGHGVNVAARLEGLADPGGVCVSARVQEDADGRLDIGFQDLGDQALKNMPQPVRAYRVLLDGTEAKAPLLTFRAPAVTQAKPSIAVLPFRNISGDADQEYLADGITEDLTIALSRSRWFFVIARESSFALKGQSLDARQIARELGVRYLLEGSVRRAGPRVRISTQLVEAETSLSLWADSQDREFTDMLLVQDEVVEQVVAALEPALIASEGARIVHKNLTDYTALDCFYRGMWHLNRVSAAGYHEAKRHFEAAIHLDPDLPLGYVGLARILYGGFVYGWSDAPRPDLERAFAAAETALSLDPRDAIAYYAHAGSALFLNRHDKALDSARRSVALNPNFAYGHVRLGQVLTYVGRPQDGIVAIERGLRRNPFDPQLGTILAALALAHYQAEHYGEAAAIAEDAFARNYRGAAVVMAASLARLGRTEDAARKLPPELLARVTRDPPRLLAYAREDDRERLLEGLRLAAGALDAAAPLTRA